MNTQITYDYAEIIHENNFVLQRKSSHCKQRNMDYSPVEIIDMGTDNVINIDYEKVMAIQQFLLFMDQHSVFLPFDYCVATQHGLKDGFGEMQFRGEYEGLVFSTQWIQDVPSHKGFLYYKPTNQILGLMYSIQEFHLFSEDDAPTFDIVDRGNGERWEGLSYDNMPCGVGDYYDDANRLIYHGMCVDFYQEGYGILYYPSTFENRTISYEGWWIHGNKFGEGIVYDTRGQLITSGYFHDDNLFAPFTSLMVNQKMNSLESSHCYIEEITIADNMLNMEMALNLDVFKKLRSFSVGSQSLRNCCSFIASHLPYLQSIVIGVDSFTNVGRDLRLLLSETDGMIALNKTCTINDLHSLEVLSIGQGSFSEYHSFTLTNVPLLTTLTIGEMGSLSCNFFYSSLLSLISEFLFILFYSIDLRSLQSVEIGNFGFYYANVAIFFQLPSLTTLEFGDACFFRFLNKSGRFVLSHLPNLEYLHLSKESFVSVYSLTLSSKIKTEK